MQLSSNINKCILCTIFDVLLGHIICKEVLFINRAKITMIVNLHVLENVPMLQSTLGNTIYYHKFIRGYA
jgi:hypothetical protein